MAAVALLGGAATAAAQVCVVIPCVPAHVPLLPRVLQSVRTQSLLPSDVVVVVSAITPNKCAALQAKLRDAARVVCSAASGWTRGANRNPGARSCVRDGRHGRTTHIAFIDADDELLPPCLERMTALMGAHRAELGTHACITVDDRLPHAPRPTPQMNDSEITMAPGMLAHLWGLDKRQHQGRGDLKRVITGGGHMGHVVITPSLLARLQYHEHYGTGPDGWQQKTANEDSVFVARAVDRSIRVVHTYEQLSVYHRHTSITQRPGLNTSDTSDAQDGDAQDTARLEGSSRPRGRSKVVAPQRRMGSGRRRAGARGAAMLDDERTRLLAKRAVTDVRLAREPGG